MENKLEYEEEIEYDEYPHANKQQTISTMIRALKKSTEKESLLDLSALLVDYYLTFAYQGSENKLVVDEYAMHMGFEVMFWLGANYKYKLEESESYMLEADFEFKTLLLDSKIKTHSLRRQWLYDWINKKESCELVNLLLVLYPTYADIKMVRKELGLNRPIEELEEEHAKLANIELKKSDEEEETDE